MKKSELIIFLEEEGQDLLRKIIIDAGNGKDTDCSFHEYGMIVKLINKIDLVFGSHRIRSK